MEVPVGLGLSKHLVRFDASDEVIDLLNTGIKAALIRRQHTAQIDEIPVGRDCIRPVRLAPHLKPTRPKTGVVLQNEVRVDLGLLVHQFVPECKMTESATHDRLLPGEIVGSKEALDPGR